MTAFEKNLVRFLIVSLCYFELPIVSAQAAMVSTHSVAAASQSEIYSFTRPVRK